MSETGGSNVTGTPNESVAVASHNEGLSVGRIAFRAPQFWESDPELWFGQVESHFSIAGITAELTKFHLVVAALDAKVLSCARDLVRTPPDENPYASLKKRLIAHFSQSESSKMRALLQDLQLGDKRPSQLLLEMRNLASDNLSNEMLKSLWLQRLPLNAQQILSVSSDTLEGLAKIADKVNEISGCNVATASVSAVGSDLDLIKQELADLKLEIRKLQKNNNRSVSPRYRKRSPFRTREGGASGAAKKFCWYHGRFGDKAKACVKPCSYSENA